jgi:hypothetical protein
MTSRAFGKQFCQLLIFSLCSRPTIQSFPNSPDNGPGPSFQFVFPNADYVPTRRAQNFSGGQVPPHIPFDLCSPILLIARRHPAMLRASVPKAAVHKNGDVFFGKNKIRPA